VNHYLLRHYPGQPLGPRLRAIAWLVAASALSGIGNPEEWRLGARSAPAGAPAPASPRPGSPALTAPIDANHIVQSRSDGGAPTERPVRSFFCSYWLPRHPGHSGGEIRDFHLLRHLVEIGRVDFFAMLDTQGDDRDDLAERLTSHLTPRGIRAEHPDWYHAEGWRQSLATRAAVIR